MIEEKKANKKLSRKSARQLFVHAMALAATSPEPVRQMFFKEEEMRKQATENEDVGEVESEQL